MYTNARTSNHLLELQREIKEEEDEIFADINSLINRQQQDDQEEDDQDQDYRENDYHDRDYQEQEYQELDHLESDPQEQNRKSPSVQSVEYQQLDDNEEEQANKYPYEYGFSNYNRDDPNEYQNVQAIIKQMTSNLPKPCVFFLEGNCRRSDCKYSHDLSNIPCKYWIEGFCFKGEMCPFLHSYNLPDGQDPSQEDEDGLESLSKKQLTPTFVIDSEADFPSLSLDAQAAAINETTKDDLKHDAIAITIRNQVLSSNASVVFKTIRKKRKKRLKTHLDFKSVC